jgi:hypothetical protein
MTIKSNDPSALLRIAAYPEALKRLKDCGDDERIDRAFHAVCREIWGYTLEDFDDDSLSAKNHPFLDRMSWKRAAPSRSPTVMTCLTMPPARLSPTGGASPG